MKLSCEKCSKVFKYKKLLNAVISNEKLTCQNCGATYKIKTQYRILIAFLISLPIFFLPFLGSQSTYFILFLAYILYIIFIALLSPIFVKLKEK